MLSSHNLLKPADGQPATSATQDIVLGIYYVTNIVKGIKGEGKSFSSVAEAMMAYEMGHVAVNAAVKVSHPEKPNEIVETTIGRLAFFEIMPEGYGFINEPLDKSRLKKIIGEVLSQHGQEATAGFLDRMKNLGFRFATHSGMSWGMDDLVVPPEKDAILNEAQDKVDTISDQYENGLLTDDERYRMTVAVWEEVREKMNRLGEQTLEGDGTVHSMVNSGARGSWTQVMQMMGMKGTVAGPTGEVVEVPIKSSFKEGFSALEYFLSTHGTRKGMADTALRTATAGYLTRRLVNVAQDVVVREEDCQDTEGGVVTAEDSEEIGTTLGARLLGRVLAASLRHPKTKKVLYQRGTLIGKEEANKIDELRVSEVMIRSVVTCRASDGICRQCYGWDLGRNDLVEIGQPVGVVAAQSIGEPGTQLTMRTFHSGGVGGEDITQGLPRVEELFEARVPKGEAVMCEIDGMVSVSSGKDEAHLTVTSKGSKVRTFDINGATLAKGIKSSKAVKDGELLFTNIHREKTKAPFGGSITIKDSVLTVRGRGKDIREYSVPGNTTLNVKNGDEVIAGQQLTEGHLNVQDLFETAGVRAVQRYILREVQQVYAIQGETINDKHLEIIVRQMLGRVRVHESGDTTLLSGRIVELAEFLLANEQAEAEKKKPAVGERLLLGITKVSLTTRSFLAAASFMETARVMIDAAVTGRADKLEGLKENVIIGRLIPVGTGFRGRETT
jgi:DNA-directed RNA polymerase subunit beta'